MSLSQINYAFGQDDVDDVYDKVNAIIDFLNGSNGWATATLGAGYTGTLEYRKIGSIVYLRGSVGDAGGVFGTPAITTLPAGYRPAAATVFNVRYSGGTTQAEGMAVSTAGVVSGVTSAGNFVVGFDGLSFLID